MAKKRGKNKSEKCPEPINTMIDIASMVTMNYIAKKRRQKNNSKGNGIDPYAVACTAMGFGKLNKAEDVIMLGGMLGAMGAFDDEPSSVDGYKPLDNRYAWCLNCEDGRAYGIDPEDYETRSEYHEALHRVKYEWRRDCEDGLEYGIDPQRFDTESDYEEALTETKKRSLDDDNS